MQPLLVNEKVTGFNNSMFLELYVKQFGADAIKGMKPGTSDSDAKGDSRKEQLKRRAEREKKREGLPKAANE